MSMARRASGRSTCVRRSVGCVLVNSRNHVLATGYNGVAIGEPHCNDVTISGDKISFDNACIGANARSGTNLDSCLAIHAEQNAILQCKDVHEIDRAYVTAFPCPSCAKLMLNTSCKTIVYGQKYGDDVGREIWLKSGRIAQEYKGAPHMVQQDLIDLFGRDGLEKWRVIVACICLNLCSARTARGTIFRILERWPRPENLADADPTELENLLRPLGLTDKRAMRLAFMSRNIDIKPTEDLPGVGPYALECIKVFCDGVLPDPDTITDRKVASWVHYHQQHRGI